MMSVSRTGDAAGAREDNGAFQIGGGATYQSHGVFNVLEERVGYLELAYEPLPQPCAPLIGMAERAFGGVWAGCLFYGSPQ